MTQAAQSTRKPFGTLGEVNARLKMLGFSQIGKGQAQAILGQVPRHRLVTALQKAHVDQGARRFLETLIPVTASNEDPPQPEPEARPEQQAASRSAPAANNRPQERSPGQQARHDQQARSQTESPRPRPARQGQSPQAGQAPAREFISHHVYGGKAALCWDVDETRNGDATIRLEAAKAIGERKYDWSNKIAIQLTRDELPCVAAVFLGILTRTEGRNHGVGDQQGKGFEVEHQGNKLFVKVFAPQKPPCAVPVSPEDAFTVTSLLVRQIRKGKPWLSGNDIMVMLRTIIGRMKTPPGQH